MEYETWTPGTKVPDWLEAHWKQNTPVELQWGSIQQRALALRRMYKEKEIKPKILFRALALDLLWACLPEGHRGGSRAIEMLMVEALGLPPWHEPGHWHAEGLETRGRPAREALVMARLIEELYRREYKERMTLYALEKEMKVAGYKTSRSVLRKWRQKKLRMPINTEIDFEYLGEWSDETLARWRAANTQRAPRPRRGRKLGS